jgi:internalin A
MTREELLALIDQAAAEGWTKLDLAGHGLTELPPEIGKLTQLETLILGKVEKWEWVEDEPIPVLVTNALTTLPSELATLTNLKTLNLSGNPLGVIPDIVFQCQRLESLTLVTVGLSELVKEIGALTNLTTLDLHSNQITEIPAVIGTLTNLTTLDLYSNQITEIPAVMGTLTNLTTLYLSSNQITEIPAVIGALTNLNTLALNSNQITEIPAVIGALTNLTTLYLYSNQITEIPAVIGVLTNLTTLNLHSNQITEIPGVIGALTNLTTLYLHSNQITEIPGAIAQLRNLTILYLGKNQITVIPEAICTLTNLTKLNLSSNQIETIPEKMGQLINLTIFQIDNNRITQIPGEIGQLTNLTRLSLDRNQIRQIPNEIRQLTKLMVLFLTENQLMRVPEAVEQLMSLTELYLHGNQITVIPEALGRLTNLIKLYLGDNQITVIPEAIAALTRLETLDLENNQIEIVPDFLQDLPNLKTLDLRGNPLPISPEVLGPANLSEAPGSVANIFNYLHQLHSGEVRPLNEAKVLLVGQGSVGKTSLINRLIHNHYNPTQPQTDGLAITHWPIQVNTKAVRLNVWDFGGQEIYHATHQFFLTKRSLYLLVCNCRTSEDENRLEYWLKLIASFGGASPVIIVGNKCDEQPLDINRKALRDKYPNIKAILETSCADNRGIAELRTAIHTEIAQLKEVYDLLPLTWFQVKEQLEQLEQSGKDFITISEYATLCAQHHILTEADQTQLVTLLHNLGLVLNFRDHPILQSTNILNPNWVTHGIYQLLSDEPLKTQAKGLLDCTELHRILDAQRYPHTRHRYLTELMREFQLCFELPDRPGHQFLIPGLLPKEEPADTHLDGDTLEFQYHYRILPDSILSRFIVLSHEKIHRHTYWRSGVMLQHCESAEICNLARIKSDPADGKIFIAINGRASTRRSFLALIRDTFTKIHNSFGNLEVEEFVPVPGHPDHPPLDYQELLGLEEMGEREYRVGKLKLRLDLRQLLDGYESVEARQRQRMRDRDFDGEFDDRHSGIHIHINQANQGSKTIHQHGQRDNFGGDQVQGNKAV